MERDRANRTHDHIQPVGDMSYDRSLRSSQSVLRKVGMVSCSIPHRLVMQGRFHLSPAAHLLPRRSDHSAKAGHGGSRKADCNLGISLWGDRSRLREFVLSRTECSCTNGSPALTEVPCVTAECRTFQRRAGLLQP